MWPDALCQENGHQWVCHFDHNRCFVCGILQDAPMTADQPDLAALRTLAAAATPGPWTPTTRLDAWTIATIATASGKRIAFADHMTDAAYIAAADPATILALLDQRDALAKQLTKVKGIGRAADVVADLQKLLDTEPLDTSTRHMLDSIIEHHTK